MDQVCIPTPTPCEDEPPELEVTVGGTTRPMAYRIETVTWGAELLLNERAEQLITFRKHCPALSSVVSS